MKAELSLPDFRQPFLWLQTKKAAGTSLRKSLAAYYPEPSPPEGCTWSGYKPTFIQLDPVYWNSVLNRYATPLGEYKFNRLLFAREYLYSNFDDIVSFAIVREPVDRCCSMFYYLYKDKAAFRERFGKGISHFTEEVDFAIFLNAITYFRKNPWNDIHFATHTATVWDDIADQQGRSLLTHAIRPDNMWRQLEGILSDIHTSRVTLDQVASNKTKARPDDASTILSKENRARLEVLFAKDFDLYETAT